MRCKRIHMGCYQRCAIAAVFATSISLLRRVGQHPQLAGAISEDRGRTFCQTCKLICGPHSRLNSSCAYWALHRWVATLGCRACTHCHAPQICGALQCISTTTHCAARWAKCPFIMQRQGNHQQDGGARHGQGAQHRHAAASSKERHQSARRRASWPRPFLDMRMCVCVRTRMCMRVGM